MCLARASANLPLAAGDLLAGRCSCSRLASQMVVGGMKESLGGFFCTKDELHREIGRSSTLAGKGAKSSMFFEGGEPPGP